MFLSEKLFDRDVMKLVRKLASLPVSNKSSTYTKK